MSKRVTVQQVAMAKAIMEEAGYIVTSPAPSVEHQAAPKTYPKGKQPFVYYLHDDSVSSLREYLEGAVNLSPEALDAAAESRPFYEIALDCEVDDKGKVSVLGFNREKSQTT